LIFKNLEEVKNDSRTTWTKQFVREVLNNMGFDCINRIDASRIDVAQARNTDNASIARSRA
jgi:hypothetical protein